MNGAIIPAVVEKHLEAIQLWEDGKLVLASSNLTGRYWNGTLFAFKSADDAPDVEKCITGHETESGIADLQCLKDDRVVIGMDSGAVQLYKLDMDTPVFMSLGYGCEHDNHVSSVAVNCDESLLISSGYDKCVKVWDIHSFLSVSTYKPVHSGIVWQVSCSPTDPQVLLSCGDDGKILLIDLRLPKPALPLSASCLKSSPTALAWKPLASEYAVGDDSGYVVVQDIRNSLSRVQYEGHKRRVHRLLFSPSNHAWLASCADATDVCVKNIDDPFGSYRDDIHDDFIRGLAWTPQNTLVTCGWDKLVLKHEVSYPTEEMASPAVAAE